MRGGYGQGAFLLGRILFCRHADIAGRLQRVLGHRDELAACVAEPDEPRAVTNEQLDAELFFEQPQLSAQAGLRNMQGSGRLGNVEVTPGDLAEVSKLLERHSARPY